MARGEFALEMSPCLAIEASPGPPGLDDTVGTSSVSLHAAQNAQSNSRSIPITLQSLGQCAACSVVAYGPSNNNSVDVPTVECRFDTQPCNLPIAVGYVHKAIARWLICCVSTLSEAYSFAGSNEA